MNVANEFGNRGYKSGIKIKITLLEQGSRFSPPARLAIGESFTGEFDEIPIEGYRLQVSFCSKFFFHSWLAPRFFSSFTIEKIEFQEDKVTISATDGIFLLEKASA